MTRLVVNVEGNHFYRAGLVTPKIWCRNLTCVNSLVLVLLQPWKRQPDPAVVDEFPPAARDVT